MQKDRRQYKRFTATAFLNRLVLLWPLPPYFGHAIKGKLIDLSGGGLAILINEIIPQGTFHNLKMTFPDNSIMESIVNAKYVAPRGKGFVHGFEFLTLAPSMAERINRMSSDYIDCEARIQANDSEICRTDCAYFSMCSKKEKLTLITELGSALDLAFKEIKDYMPSTPPIPTDKVLSENISQDNLPTKKPTSSI